MVNNADWLEGLYVGAVGVLFNGGDPRNTIAVSPDRIVSTVYVAPDSELLAHELGHTQQYRDARGRTDIFNSAYIVGAVLSGFDHSAHPMEQDANRRVGLPVSWPSERSAPDWEFPFWHLRYQQITR